MGHLFDLCSVLMLAKPSEARDITTQAEPDEDKNLLAV